ncbi:hypothetical protein [Acidianus sp. HS-5]|uniref:hypothetical protein n=1 Tax=Acidianus sp. HS-5 TaxID=2886040 RepID=UPI001F15AE0C|nr:hypothetical protein [Acidianus sp. HS-5]BDC17525.1 hypothetical protein HS5_04150 [Acidianus sp. HS-5]
MQEFDAEVERLISLLKEKGLSKGFPKKTLYDAVRLVVAKRMGVQVEIEPPEGLTLNQYRARLFDVIAKISQVYKIENNEMYYLSLLDKFKLPQEVKEEITRIVTSNKEVFFNGKNPRGSIGAILYLVVKKYGLNLTEKELANTIGITEVTIRHRVKDIKKSYRANEFHHKEKVFRCFFNRY